MLTFDVHLFFAFCFVRTQGTCVYEEVCMFKTFKTNCLENEVIVIEKAIYGHGPNGNKCEKDGTTDVGSCSFDVLAYFNRKCGGRPTCKIEIPNKDLSVLKGQSCESQLNFYLAISYNCVYVYSAPGETCVNNQSLTVSTFDGYLSSIVAFETNKGSSMCPWKIPLNHGQSVRFKLIELGLLQSNLASNRGPVCRIYAKFLLHHYTGEIKSYVACVSDFTQQNLTIDASTAREVEISLANPSNQGEAVTSFLIKYEVFYRCPEFNPPLNSFITKTSNGLRVTCSNNADTNWILQCVDGRWMPDLFRTCYDLISAGSTSSPFDYVFYQCPAFTPPANAFVTKISNGLRVTCSKKTETHWMLQCIDGRWMPDPFKTCDDLISAHSTSSPFDYGMRQQWILMALPIGIVLLCCMLVFLGVFWRFVKKKRPADMVSNSCSSAHHYSEVDTEQDTPAIITDTISETPDVVVDQIHSTTLTPYLSLDCIRAVSIPTVYSGLHDENRMVEDSQHSDADDPDTTRESMTHPYENVVSQ